MEDLVLSVQAKPFRRLSAKLPDTMSLNHVRQDTEVDKLV